MIILINISSLVSLYTTRYLIEYIEYNIQYILYSINTNTGTIHTRLYRYSYTKVPGIYGKNVKTWLPGTLYTWLYTGIYGTSNISNRYTVY